MHSPSPLISPTPIPRSAQAKILVVEDDILVSSAMREIFRIGFGLEIDIASNGVTAFERLCHHQYALIVSDLRMPEMTGTELYLWLSEAQPAMAKRFVFVTAYPEDRHFEVELAQWGIPVLAKPFTMSQLTAVCGPFLNRARVEAP